MNVPHFPSCILRPGAVVAPPHRAPVPEGVSGTRMADRVDVLVVGTGPAGLGAAFSLLAARPDLSDRG